MTAGPVTSADADSGRNTPTGVATPTRPGGPPANGAPPAGTSGPPANGAPPGRPGGHGGDPPGGPGGQKPSFRRTFSAFKYPKYRLLWISMAVGMTGMQMQMIAQGLLAYELSGTFTVWLLLLFERLAGLRPDAGRDLTRIWPSLELLVHGGVRFDPYKPQFDSWLRGRPVDYREAYAASEGFIASSDRGFGEGLRLHLDTGLFYEFVPMEDLAAAQPVRHWAGTVETGVDYAILLSTCAGLWSWLLGDTVRFVARDPPRLLVTGRTGYTMSAFGEHLTGEEIDRAVSRAAAEAGLAVSDYAMGAVFPTAGQPLGGHRYVVEFAGGLPEAPALDRFAGALDRDLAAGNEDYAAHRAGGFGLRAPEILAVPPGFFAGWMKRRGKLGGQHKVPRIIGDSALFGGLLRAGADAAGGEGS